MEEKKKAINLHPSTKPSYEELQSQLMQAQQSIAALRMEAQNRIEALNYSNAFQQQQFMMEIIKMKDSFPPVMVEKAVAAINDFWFEEPENKEVTNGEEQGE